MRYARARGREPHPGRGLADEFCMQMVSGNHRVSDATFRAAGPFRRPGARELVMTLAYFAMIALPLNAFEIEMSAAQKASASRSRRAREAQAPWTPADGAPRPLPPSAKARWRAPGFRFAPATMTSRPCISTSSTGSVRTAGGSLPCFRSCSTRPTSRNASPASASSSSTTRSPAGAESARLAHQAPRARLRLRLGGAPGRARRRPGRPSDRPLEHRRPPAGLTGEQQALADCCHQLLRGNHHVSDAVTTRR